MLKLFPAARWSTRLGLLLLLSVVLFPGCIEAYTYRSARIKVVDAETGEPVPHAQVTPAYQYAWVLNPPKAVTGETGPDGGTVIRTATYYHGWNIRAENYLANDGYRDGYIESSSPDDFLIRIFRQPAPSVAIVVPENYHGPLIVETVQIAKEPPETRGKRDFVFTPSAKGFVHIDRSPLLQRREVYPMKYHFPDGKEIPRPDCDDDAETIAMRFIAANNGCDVYVIGTLAEKDALSARFFPGDPNKRQLDEKAFQAFVEEHRR